MNIDWTQVLVAFIAGLPILIASIGTFIITLRNKQETKLLKEHVNSKMDALLVANSLAAGLKGEKRGRAEEQARPTRKP